MAEIKDSIVDIVKCTDKMSKLFNVALYSGEQEVTIEVEKKFNIKQYETETVRASCKVKMNDINELDRMLAVAITSSDIEYTLYSEAYIKGLVTDDEFKRRSSDIKEAIARIAGMVERVNPNSSVLNAYKESLVHGA